MQKDFYIDRRFFVMPAAHLLTDLSANKINRLDPTITQVICILAEREGKPVSREELLREVWPNDAHGDQHLSQAIITLNKLLAEAGTDLIKSVPQKSYTLHADVIYGDIKAFENLPEPTPRGNLSPSLKRWIIIITMAVIALAIYFIFSN